MLSESIAKLVQYGITTGLTPECERNYTTNLLLDVFYEEVPGYQHEWDFWDLSLQKAICSWLPILHREV